MGFPKQIKKIYKNIKNWTKSTLKRSSSDNKYNCNSSKEELKSDGLQMNSSEVHDTDTRNLSIVTMSKTAADQHSRSGISETNSKDSLHRHGLNADKYTKDFSKDNVNGGVQESCSQQTSSAIYCCPSGYIPSVTTENQYKVIPSGVVSIEQTHTYSKVIEIGSEENVMLDIKKSRKINAEQNIEKPHNVRNVTDIDSKECVINDYMNTLTMIETLDVKKSRKINTGQNITGVYGGNSSTPDTDVKSTSPKFNYGKIEDADKDRNPTMFQILSSSVTSCTEVKNFDSMNQQLDSVEQKPLAKNELTKEAMDKPRNLRTFSNNGSFSAKLESASEPIENFSIMLETPAMMDMLKCPEFTSYSEESCTSTEIDSTSTNLIIFSESCSVAMSEFSMVASSSTNLSNSDRDTNGRWNLNTSQNEKSENCFLNRSSATSDVIDQSMKPFDLDSKNEIFVTIPLHDIETNLTNYGSKLINFINPVLSNHLEEKSTNTCRITDFQLVGSDNKHVIECELDDDILKTQVDEHNEIISLTGCSNYKWLGFWIVVPSAVYSWLKSTDLCTKLQVTIYEHNDKSKTENEAVDYCFINNILSLVQNVSGYFSHQSSHGSETTRNINLILEPVTACVSISNDKTSLICGNSYLPVLPISKFKTNAILMGEHLLNKVYDNNILQLTLNDFIVDRSNIYVENALMLFAKINMHLKQQMSFMFTTWLFYVDIQSPGIVNGSEQLGIVKYNVFKQLSLKLVAIGYNCVLPVDKSGLNVIKGTLNVCISRKVSTRQCVTKPRRNMYCAYCKCNVHNKKCECCLPHVPHSEVSECNDSVSEAQMNNDRWKKSISTYTIKHKSKGRYEFKHNDFGNDEKKKVSGTEKLSIQLAEFSNTAIDSGIESGFDNSITISDEDSMLMDAGTKGTTLGSLKPSLEHRSKYTKICNRLSPHAYFLLCLEDPLVRQIITDNELREVAKSVVREMHPTEHIINLFVLERYFNMLESRLPTMEEQMQFEWLRLASFSTYQGNGNALALARNGFYHDSSQGPNATRCIYCGATHSTWNLFDNTDIEHKRMSPTCPLLNHMRDEANIPIAENAEHTTPATGETSATSAASIFVSQSSTSSSSTFVPRTSIASVSMFVSRMSTASTTASASTLEPKTSTASVGASAAIDNLSIDNLQRLSVSQARNEGTSNSDETTGYESIVQQPTNETENQERESDIQPNFIQTFGFTGPRYTNLIAPVVNNVAEGARTNESVTTSVPSITTNQAPLMAVSSLGNPATFGRQLQSNFPGAGAFSRQTAQPTVSETDKSNTTNIVSDLGPGIGRADITAGVVVTNPKHPDYSTLESRTNSYQDWPAYLNQTARQMAEAGFFFVGVSDFTRCFACGGGLRNWEPGDDPVLEHTRWFPRCEYVNKLKGERYVQAVERRHREHMAEQQRQQNEIALKRAAMRRPPDASNTRAGTVLREMGYSEDRTRQAIDAVRQQIGLSVTDVTPEQALTWILEEEERQSVAVQQIPVSGSSASMSMPFNALTTTVAYPMVQLQSSSATATAATVFGSQSKAANGTGKQSSVASASGSSKASLCDSGKQTGHKGVSNDDDNERESQNATKKTGKKKKKTRKKSSSKPPDMPISSASGGLSMDAKTLQMENEMLRELQTCKICMQQPVDTTLMPCGHLVTCEPCAKRLAKCPICRKVIKGTVKTFMS